VQVIGVVKTGKYAFLNEAPEPCLSRLHVFAKRGGVGPTSYSMQMLGWFSAATAGRFVGATIDPRVPVATSPGFFNGARRCALLR
jgi:hypothetical protein